MKSVLFCRVSSREQEIEGYSLPAQEKLLKDYTLRKDIVWSKIFSISESASGKKQRETFSEMMNFLVEKNIKIIVCEKVDRLTRSLKDAVIINDWINGDSERQVHFVKENVVLNKDSKSNEKFIWNIKVSVAQYYIDNLSEEVKKGQKEKIAQGWLPTKPPLGYKTAGERGHKVHIVDENKAPLIKKMFELYESGNYSVKSLTKIMNEKGLRNLSGTVMQNSRIHQLLKDPFYYGRIRWKGEIYNGKHEALISSETFEKVQGILKGRNTPKFSKHQFVFKGLIRCVECNGLITWEIHKGIIYGHCNHYRNCSQKTWSKEKEVEKQLVETFEKLQIKNNHLAEWIKKALKESHDDEIVFHTTATEELYNAEKRLKQRLDRLYDDKLDNKIPEVFYQQKFKQYSQELESVSNELKKHDNASIKYLEAGMNIFELSQKAKETYLRADSEKKRMLLKLIFERINLDEGKVNFSYNLAFKILSQAVSLTNSSKIIKIAEKEDRIFEHAKKPVIWGQSDNFSANRPVLLAGWDDFRTFTNL